MNAPRPYLRAFWTPALGMLLFWGYAVVAGITAAFALARGAIVVALVFVGTIVVARVWVEMTLILFQIHDVLVSIRDQPIEAEKRAKLLAARGVAQARPVAPGEMRLGD